MVNLGRYTNPNGCYWDSFEREFSVGTFLEWGIAYWSLHGGGVDPSNDVLCLFDVFFLVSAPYHRNIFD